MEKQERRDYASEVRAEPQGRENRIGGYASVFDVPYPLYGETLEVVRPGAFSASLAREDRILGLFNHDPSIPLGSSEVGDLRVWEDDHGLGYEIRGVFGPTIQDQVLDPIRKGIVRHSSFGFVVEEEGWTRLEDGHELREIRAAKLYDVSPVTFPASEFTESQVRALEARRLAAGSDPVHDSRSGRDLLRRRLWIRQRKMA